MWNMMAIIPRILWFTHEENIPPAHTVADPALRLSSEYYEDEPKWVQKKELMGPFILQRAREMATSANPSHVGKYVETSRASEEKKRSYGSTRPLVERDRGGEFPPDFPKRARGACGRDDSGGCDFIATDNIGGEMGATAIGYFYSRI